MRVEVVLIVNNQQEKNISKTETFVFRLSLLKKYAKSLFSKVNKTNVNSFI